MTLTLPGPTSSGTAFWAGGPSPPFPAPIYTGDSFVLTTGLGFGQLSPAFTGNNLIQCLGNLHAICDFNISWSETAGQLDGIKITIDGGDGAIGVPGFSPAFGIFGLHGGGIATDNVLGGCVEVACGVTGFWQSDLPVSEPMSAALLTSGLLGLGLARRYLRSSARGA
jgi:hypothetical protein